MMEKKNGKRFTFFYTSFSSYSTTGNNTQHPTKKRITRRGIIIAKIARMIQFMRKKRVFTGWVQMQR